MIDFEDAAYNAFNDVFGPDGVVVDGCLFHFDQCIYRRVYSLKLRDVYRDEHGPCRRWIRRLMALPMVPPDVAVLLFDSNLSRFPNTVQDVDTRRKCTELRNYYRYRVQCTRALIHEYRTVYRI